MLQRCLTLVLSEQGFSYFIGREQVKKLAHTIVKDIRLDIWNIGTLTSKAM